MSKGAGFGLLAIAAWTACATSADAGSGGGHGGGGGGSHTTTRYVYVPTYTYNSGPLTPQGAPMELPLELTDAPPQRIDGEMAPGDVIAQHGLRALRARVLLAPVNGRRGVLPAGAVLAEMATPIAGLSVWCEIDARRAFFGGPIHDCLSEQGGKFVQLWVGESPSHFLASDSSVVRAGAVLPSPIAYREALPEERPVGLMGFKWCEGDGLAAPPRFALAVTTPGDGKWMTDTVAGCRFGFWPDPKDHAHVDVDGLGVTVAPGAKPGDLKFSVFGRIGPIAEIQPLSLSGPMQVAHDTSPYRTAAASTSGSERATTLTAAGAPTISVTGEIGAGQVFLTLPVRHALTAVLLNAVHVHNFGGGYDLPVNQPLFGLPAHGGDPSSIVWCAPRLSADEGRADVKWKTTCLAEQDGGVSAIDIPTAMMATALPWSRARQASPIDVRQGPVTLPPMTLTYVFLGFTDPDLPTRFARVEMRLDWGEGPKAIRSVSTPVGPDGAAHFTLLDGTFEFRPQPSAPGRRSAIALANLAVTVQPKAKAPM